MDKLIKDGIKTLKRMGLKDTHLTELCIHMETAEGEIMEVDIELDDMTGEIEKQYNLFENEEDYDSFLEHDEVEVPENGLYN